MEGRNRDTGWLLTAVLLVQFMVALDVSVVNVALPDMRDDLGFSPGGLQWVVGAYALAFGGLLMLGGRLADLVGGRRILPAGLAFFGAASLVGGLVSDPGALIAARAAQGVGAAAVSPVALALVTLSFPEGPARSRALGLWGVAGALGGAVGVLAGGLLTDAAGWRAVMLVNVPIVLLALFATGRARLPGRRAGAAPRLDLAGALLVTAGMTLLVLAVVRTESTPWGSPATLLPLGAALALLAAFVAVERRTPLPLLRLGLFGVRPVLGANLFTLLLCSGQFASFYFCSLYMQQVLGWDAATTGAAFLPFSAGVVTGSVIATKVIARTGTRDLLALGGLLGTAGLALFAYTATPDGTFLYSIVAPSLLASVGIGMSFVPLATAAVTGVAPDEAGMASGLLSSSRQLGGSLGLAVLVTLAASATGSGTDPAALAAGHRTAYAVSAALLALGTLLAFVLLPGRSRGASEDPGEKNQKDSGGDVDPQVSRSTQG
ncbi:MFS transporter [Streptomyces clavuligerus]|uniref:Putative permease of the major facilitator superfamily n=1 Tax=Streptomyces clavuligerus TaxID=1901 RepID=B5GYT9_STRCL|nr:MFS transporter [Streptomyces clavuligerus]ANW18584.1 MFS transporter [Streptomyces clavuligerus]AXU13145.1 MFS transporter [Streptomyces clavuligerus]EDY51485.1 membrane transport protein [Streptomyces clavuligerus]EFG08759.1 Putative permease of the major facilitator superfamily [Streptomyces clavuligerus]MBY6303087.1 MFS transporter [Streptomyces clavuligerus]